VIQDSMLGCGADAGHAYDGALIVSELVSNAVRHAPALPSGHLIVEWCVLDAGVEISVTDGGHVERLVPAPSIRSTDTGGRGLSIIDTLATNWGVRSDTGRTVVWALAPLGGGPVPNRRIELGR
jgi:anti-sigma regulatory factor (Ser/Thr protein kinase)